MKYKNHHIELGIGIESANEAYSLATPFTDQNEKKESIAFFTIFIVLLP